MNDAIETIAIKKALGEEKAREAFVSSTKSMTGHMLGAAGAIEALACIFALQESIIPPTINLNEQDEACDLNCVPNTAVKTPVTLALSKDVYKRQPEHICPDLSKSLSYYDPPLCILSVFS